MPGTDTSGVVTSGGSGHSSFGSSVMGLLESTVGSVGGAVVDPTGVEPEVGGTV